MFSMFKNYNLDIKKEHFILKSIYILAICLFIYKSRLFFIEPRIWAEEGTVYLKDALVNGFKSLFSIHQGYYSIIPNITFYISTLFGYKNIPYFSLFTSLSVWFTLFVVIKNLRDTLYKILLFISLFILLNQYQQLFLNTINLQFITPLILLIFLQNDLENLDKKQHVFFLIIIFFALMNGVLGFILLPYTIYKLIASKLYKTIIFCVVCTFLYSIIFFVFRENSGDLSLGQRISCNFNIKYEYWQKNQISFFKMHSYILLPFASLLFLIKKKYEVSIILITIFFNFSFIDLTKLCNLQITERYRVYLYASTIIFFYQMVYRYSYKQLLYIPTVIIAIFFSKSFFEIDHAYCKECAKWSVEHKNLLEKKRAKIHPKGWELNLNE